MSKREGRVDRISIRFDMSTVQDDPRGYLSVWGTVITGGTLLTYGRGDGLDVDEWIELVPDDTVFDESALATLKHSPITFHHPPEMLDTTNTSRFQVGTLTDWKRFDRKLRALHQFTDDRVIQAVRAGVIELSPGYTALIDRRPGRHNGRPYHAIQRDRVYNHEAVVPEARAGHDNALDRIDALRKIFRTDDLRVSTLRKADTMATIKLPDGTEEEVSDTVAAAFNQLIEANSGGDGDDAPPTNDNSEGEGGGRPSSDADDDDDEDSTDDAPAPASGGRASSTSVTVTTDSKPVTRGELLQVIASTRKDTATDVLKALDKRDAKARADSATQAEVIAGAKRVLPRSYSYDGKPVETIMFDAIVAAKPGAKAKAGKIRKDSGRLRGMFDMLVEDAPEGDRTDSGGLGQLGRNDSQPPAENRIDSARLDAQKRRDAATRLGSSHRLGGQRALQSEHIVNFDSAKAGKQGAA